MHSEQKAHRGINAYYRRTVAAIILSVLIYASQRVPLFRSLTAASILFNRVHYRAYTHKKQDITTASPPLPPIKKNSRHTTHSSIVKTRRKRCEIALLQVTRPKTTTTLSRRERERCDVRGERRVSRPFFYEDGHAAPYSARSPFPSALYERFCSPQGLTGTSDARGEGRPQRPPLLPASLAHK